MSDPVLLAIITSVTTVLTVIITGIINARASRKRSEAVVEKVQAVVEKVDTYHNEVNGKVSQLLVTTKALGVEEGKAKEKEDQADKDQK